MVVRMHFTKLNRKVQWMTSKDFLTHLTFKHVSYFDWYFLIFISILHGNVKNQPKNLVLWHSKYEHDLCRSSLFRWKWFVNNLWCETNTKPRWIRVFFCLKKKITQLPIILWSNTNICSDCYIFNSQYFSCSKREII